MAKIETGFSHKRLQWKIDDEQLANYPSYGRWPVRCFGCGFPGRAETTEVDGFTFLCQACVKPNTVRRHGNTIRVLPGVSGSFGRLVTIGILVDLLAWLAIAPLGITTISPVSGVTPARRLKPRI